MSSSIMSSLHEGLSCVDECVVHMDLMHVPHQSTDREGEEVGTWDMRGMHM